MAENEVISNAGAGGAHFGVNQFTDTDSVVRVVPYSQLAYGAQGSPPVIVTAAVGLPVVQTGALPAGTNSIGTVILGAGSATIGTVNLGTVAGIALDATVAKLNIAQGAALGSNTGPLIQGSVTTSAPVYTTGQVSPLSLTPAGLLRVDASGTTVPVSGTFWQATQPVSAASLPLPSGASTSAKQAALGTAGTASADVISIQGVALMTPVVVSGSGTFTVAGTITANQGTAAALASAWPVKVTDGTNTMPTGDASARTIHVTADNATIAVTQSGAPWSENITQFGGSAIVTGTGAGGAGIPRVTVSNDSVVGLGAGSASIGTVQPGNTANTTPWLVSQRPAVSGGLSVSRLIAAAGANQDSTNVKGSAGQVFGWSIYNTTAAVRYVKLYDKATAPTSADTPKETLLIPGNAAGAGNNKARTLGVAYASGIGFRITTGVADNDTGTVTANDVVVNLEYA